MPPYITKEDIKRQYKSLAKKYHPDISNNSEKMHLINEAYKVVMNYIENYRYSFDDDEILKQMPTYNFNNKFRL